MPTLKPIIIFGGTFDPVHNGHLHIAKACLKAFNPQELRFVPCAQNVLKSATPTASSDDRLNMLTLALKNYPQLVIDDTELKRGSPSYMIDTIENLQAEVNNPLYLLMSSDSFAELTKWHRYQDLLKLTNMIVTPRPGFDQAYPAEVKAILAEHQTDSLAKFSQKSQGLIKLHSVLDPLTIAASLIRRTIERGGNASHWLPAKVWQYINEHNVYRNNASN